MASRTYNPRQINIRWRARTRNFATGEYVYLGTYASKEEAEAVEEYYNRTQRPDWYDPVKDIWWTYSQETRAWRRRGGDVDTGKRKSGNHHGKRSRVHDA